MSKVGWPAGRRARRLVWFCGVSVAAVAVGVLLFRPASQTPASAPTRTPHSAATSSSRAATTALPI